MFIQKKTKFLNDYSFWRIDQFNPYSLSQLFVVKISLFLIIIAILEESKFLPIFLLTLILSKAICFSFLGRFYVDIYNSTCETKKRLIIWKIDIILKKSIFLTLKYLFPS